MNTLIFSSNKSKNALFSKTMLVFFILLGFMLSLTTISLGKEVSYTPTAPTGITAGYVDIEYEYFIQTMNYNSSWMFDWGDGTNSTWLQLEEAHTIIVHTHHWSESGIFQLRIRFKSNLFPYDIWSEPLNVTISQYTTSDIPNSPVLRTGTIQGTIGEIYTYSVVSSDPHDCPLCYRFDWGNGNYSEWTTYTQSGAVSLLSNSWETSGDYSIRAQARNYNGLASLWSDPTQVSIQDRLEGNIVCIDCIVLSQCLHQIIFSSNTAGIFYNSSSGGSSAAQWVGANEFLIDDDGDEQGDYLFCRTTGAIQSIELQVPLQDNIIFKIPWFLVILLGIIGGSIITFFILLKMGYVYFYEEVIVQK